MARFLRHNESKDLLLGCPNYEMSFGDTMLEARPQPMERVKHMINAILPTIAVAALALIGARASELLRARAAEPAPCADASAPQVAWEYVAPDAKTSPRARWIPIRRDKTC